MAIPEINSLEGVPTLVATPMYYTYHALLRSNSITDGNGNRFRASLILFTGSNDSRVYVQKIAPNGVTVLGHVQVALQLDGQIVKHDDFGLDYSGNDLIINNGGHALTPGQRKSPYCEARWVGVFENPGALVGTRGGASVSPEPAPQEGDVTPGEIVTAITEALNTNSPLRRALHGAVMAAMIDTLYSGQADPIILDEGEIDQRIRTMLSGTSDLYSSPGLYSRLNQTVWEQLHKVMNERGVGEPPPPPKEETEGEQPK